MNCPTCSVPLTMSDRQGVEIDFCPQCRGVWLDRGELDKILERSSGYAPRTARPEVAREWESHHGYDSRKRRKRGFLDDIFDFD